MARKTLRLSADLSDRIDVARGFESWSSWVTRQLEAAVEGLGAEGALVTDGESNPLREFEPHPDGSAFVKPRPPVQGVVPASSLVACPECGALRGMHQKGCKRSR